jgi:hypothetical protein
MVGLIKHTETSNHCTKTRSYCLRTECTALQKTKLTIIKERKFNPTEEDQNHNNKTKMYQTIHQLKKGHQHTFNTIRNKKAELVMNTKEKAEIWKEYFDKLLNTKDPKELIKTGNKEISEVKVEESTTEDVKN